MLKRIPLFFFPLFPLLPPDLHSIGVSKTVREGRKGRCKDLHLHPLSSHLREEHPFEKKGEREKGDGFLFPSLSYELRRNSPSGKKKKLVLPPLFFPKKVRLKERK